MNAAMSSCQGNDGSTPRDRDKFSRFAGPDFVGMDMAEAGADHAFISPMESRAHVVRLNGIETLPLRK